MIVIGATNYVEKVDPALRRAGRLDQVVEIPLPNVEGLEQIFGYYLSLFGADGGAVAADVDARTRRTGVRADRGGRRVLRSWRSPARTAREPAGGAQRLGGRGYPVVLDAPIARRG